MLALDLGVKRTGWAVSTSGRLVTPGGVLLTRPRAGFIKQLRAEISRLGVERLIVGETGLQVIADDRAAAIGWLERELALPVVAIDEHQTTGEARRQTGRKDHADETAAGLILERYLDEQ